MPKYKVTFTKRGKYPFDDKVTKHVATVIAPDRNAARRQVETIPGHYFTKGIRRLWE